MKKIMIWIYILFVCLIALLLFVEVKPYEQTISAALGGLIAGGFSLFAIKLNHSYDLDLQREQEEKEVINLLKALHTELTTLWSRYQRRIGKKLDELKSGELFDMPVSMTQDYFTVYNANASLVGKIEDNNLRELIVKHNIEAKSLIDNFLMHNNTIQEFRNWAIIYKDNPTEDNKIILDRLHSRLIDFAAALKEQHANIKKHTDTLDKALNEYLLSK